MRASKGTGSLAPTGMTVRVSITRSIFAWTSRGSSAISSRKSVPLSASRKCPGLSRTAPVKAPRRCPKSSLSSGVGGSAAQMIARKGPACRGESAWRACPHSSFGALTPRGTSPPSNASAPGVAATTWRLASRKRAGPPNSSSAMSASAPGAGPGTGRRPVVGTTGDLAFWQTNVGVSLPQRYVAKAHRQRATRLTGAEFLRDPCRKFSAVTLGPRRAGGMAPARYATCSTFHRMSATPPRPKPPPRRRRPLSSVIPAVVWCAIAMLAFLLLVLASGGPDAPDAPALEERR